MFHAVSITFRLNLRNYLNITNETCEGLDVSKRNQEDNYQCWEEMLQELIRLQMMSQLTLSWVLVDSSLHMRCIVILWMNYCGLCRRKVNEAIRQTSWCIFVFYFGRNTCVKNLLCTCIWFVISLLETRHFATPPEFFTWLKGTFN